MLACVCLRRNKMVCDWIQGSSWWIKTLCYWVIWWRSHDKANTSSQNVLPTSCPSSVGDNITLWFARNLVIHMYTPRLFKQEAFKPKPWFPSQGWCNYLKLSCIVCIKGIETTVCLLSSSYSYNVLYETTNMKWQAQEYLMGKNGKQTFEHHRLFTIYM